MKKAAAFIALVVLTLAAGIWISRGRRALPDVPAGASLPAAAPSTLPAASPPASPAVSVPASRAASPPAEPAPVPAAPVSAPVPVEAPLLPDVIVGRRLAPSPPLLPTADPAPPPSPADGPSAAPAPSPEPARPPAPDPAAADLAAVQETLERYRQVYNQLDAAAAAAIWPSVDSGALVEIFARLAQQALEFEGCAVALSGSAATAHCTGLLSYVPRVGSTRLRTERHSWAIDLERSGERWLIVQVRAR